jgi:hypothetical protein
MDNIGLIVTTNTLQSLAVYSFQPFYYVGHLYVKKYAAFNINLLCWPTMCAWASLGKKNTLTTKNRPPQNQPWAKERAMKRQHFLSLTPQRGNMGNKRNISYISARKSLLNVGKSDRLHQNTCTTVFMSICACFKLFLSVRRSNYLPLSSLTV